MRHRVQASVTFHGPMVLADSNPPKLGRVEWIAAVPIIGESAQPGVRISNPLISRSSHRHTRAKALLSSSVLHPKRLRIQFLHLRHAS